MQQSVTSQNAQIIRLARDKDIIHETLVAARCCLLEVSHDLHIMAANDEPMQIRLSQVREKLERAYEKAEIESKDNADKEQDKKDDSVKISPRELYS